MHACVHVYDRIYIPAGTALLHIMHMYCIYFSTICTWQFANASYSLQASYSFKQCLQGYNHKKISNICGHYRYLFSSSRILAVGFFECLKYGATTYKTPATVGLSLSRF